MAVTIITSENFESEVLQSDKPVIVDFWADWCGPCKRLSPAIEELSAETEEVKLCKVNVDEQPQLASRFRVMSIPTLIQKWRSIQYFSRTDSEKCNFRSRKMMICQNMKTEKRTI